MKYFMAERGSFGVTLGGGYCYCFIYRTYIACCECVRHYVDAMIIDYYIYTFVNDVCERG